ncbi:MAG: ABC transporter ATP-binding protein [Vibrio sp.]
MPSIHLNDLTKRYHINDAPAVDQLNLTVNDGEFLCLLGPSGCGKTTILRMIAGIESISDGRIVLDDIVIDSVAEGRFVPPEQRQIGLVFQSYALWPHMTVEQNVAFGLKLKKVPLAERQQRCRDVMDKLRISEYATRYPAQLSGGQQQRVALARMLAVNPKVLLLDEPLSNLDATLRLEMRNELRRLHQSYGTTIVFVSHDQWEAMTLATRIAVMSKGQLQQVGTPNEIYATPTNRFVAEFIGHPPMNMIDMQNHHSLLVQHIQALTCIAPSSQWCGIRPEVIDIATSARPDALPMIVESIIPTGGNWIIELTAGEDTLRCCTNRLPTFALEYTVYAILPTSELHLFDSDHQRIFQPCELSGHSQLDLISSSSLKPIYQFG